MVEREVLAQPNHKKKQISKQLSLFPKCQVLLLLDRQGRCWYAVGLAPAGRKTPHSCLLTSPIRGSEKKSGKKKSEEREEKKSDAKALTHCLPQTDMPGQSPSNSYPAQNC